MNNDDDRFALMMDAYTELKPELETARPPKPTPDTDSPTLGQVLAGFGPMLDEALFLGVASDELPVLLNLHDPLPGPLLIISDPGAGKTALLQTIARAVEIMHQPGEVQFGALTSHPEEWSGFEKIPHVVGVFSVHDRSSEDFILSLASWAHGNKSSRQSVLLLLDGLDTVTNMEVDAVQNLRWLLLRGPSRRVWPIITLSTQSFEKMAPWLDAFRTRILGGIEDESLIQQLGADQAKLETLETGSEFTLREGNRWLRFWIPGSNE
jgi:hypothetical protein